MILLLQEVLWKLVFTVGLLGSLCEGSISCKNEGGADVDWFILYKKNDGFKYVYTDSKDQNLKKGNKDINDQAGVLAHTLKPYFENYDTPSPDLEFIAYNDQPPPDDETVGQSYGHSKGVVMKDNNAVVWLLHSTPRFPFSGEKKDFYPKSGETNAQIFLCVTLESTEFKEIGMTARLYQHLKDIKAYRFEESQPEKRARRTSVSSYSKVLKSKGGQEFKRFVKNVSKDRDAKGEISASFI
uniref:Deoxyribonuclease-2-alpha n=1 Tax=Amphilophus citrinellus TaxID=61819 RepID=A0A3Q0RM58_AMPCI